jgi:hypothetical protein
LIRRHPDTATTLSPIVFLPLIVGNCDHTTLKSGTEKGDKMILQVWDEAGNSWAVAGCERGDPRKVTGAERGVMSESRVRNEPEVVVRRIVDLEA